VSTTSSSRVHRCGRRDPPPATV